MSYPSDLNDLEWSVIEKIIPSKPYFNDIYWNVQNNVKEDQ